MKRLRELREKRGWSQQDLATRVGVSRATIAQYENNTRTPQGDILVRLAYELGVSSAYLLGLTDSPEREDRLPEDWQAVVEEAMGEGFTPEEVREILRGLRQVLGKGKCKGKGTKKTPPES